jgi:hypothetical protein
MFHSKQTVRWYLNLLPIIAALILPLQGSQQRPLSETKLEAWDDFAFNIEDSRTRVGIASVYLTVSELKPIDGELIGYYEIDVPLMRSKNDSGRIVLPIDMSVDQLGKTGGVLKGIATSKQDASKRNKIVCEIRPMENKAIRLAITTSERTLHFVSKYTVVEVKDEI